MLGGVFGRTNCIAPALTLTLEWGPLLGVSIWRLTATAYLFAPGQDDPFFAVAIGGSF
jgi:hypothetical protein